MYYQCMEGLRSTANTRSVVEKARTASAVRIIIASIFAATTVKNYHHERRREGTPEGSSKLSTTNLTSLCVRDFSLLLSLVGAIDDPTMFSYEQWPVLRFRISIDICFKLYDQGVRTGGHDWSTMPISQSRKHISKVCQQGKFERSFLNITSS